jgi:Lrp/AsnC family leucine-responsive transcriptional regulator
MGRAHNLDEVDRRILAILEEDARKPASHIAREVGLSAASVADRIARLGDLGVIAKFTVQFGAESLGFPIAALVKFQPNSTSDAKAVRMAVSHPAVRSCYKVTGDALLVLIVRTRTAAELDAFLIDLNVHGRTESSLILNAELENRPWFARDERDPVEELRRGSRAR